jgi:hypothetical protein
MAKRLLQNAQQVGLTVARYLLLVNIGFLLEQSLQYAVGFYILRRRS